MYLTGPVGLALVTMDGVKLALFLDPGLGLGLALGLIFVGLVTQTRPKICKSTPSVPNPATF